MITGRRIGSNPLDVTLEGAQTNKVWVRSTDESREETQAWGWIARANLPVWVDFNESGELQVIHVDHAEASRSAGAQLFSMTMGAVSGESAIIDLVGQNLRFGRVGPSSEAGLKVSVQGFISPAGDNVTAVNAFPLTAPGTAGKKAWIAVVYNELTQSLEEVTGVLYDDFEYLDPTLAREDFVLGSHLVWLGAAEVTNGQTTGPTKFADLRNYLGRTLPRVNVEATVDPSVTDDEDAGYSVGSIWINVTDGKAFTLVDATAGAAVWIEGGGGSGVLNNWSATVDPTVNDDSGDGYAQGSLWYNVNKSPEINQLHICLDATAGAAIWRAVYPLEILEYSTLLSSVPEGGDWMLFQPDAGNQSYRATVADLFVTLQDYPMVLNFKSLGTPQIIDFSNATHDHEDAAGGGTLNASAIAAGLLAPARRFSEIVVTSTGNIDDLAISDATVILMNNASDATIRGIAGGVAGQRLTIVSIGAGNVFLAHQNAGSSAANRLINMVTSANSPLVAGKGYASYVYDATTSRWRMVDHFQGGVLSFAMTWTSTGTAPTIGNGTNTAEYEIQRNMCFITFLIVMGSTTTYGTGTWLFVMPFSRVGGSTRNLIGQISDASAGLIRQVMNTWNSAVNIALAPDSASNIGPTIPWTWATSDTIAVSGWYRIA